MRASSQVIDWESLPLVHILALALLMNLKSGGASVQAEREGLGEGDAGRAPGELRRDLRQARRWRGRSRRLRAQLPLRELRVTAAQTDRHLEAAQGASGSWPGPADAAAQPQRTRSQVFTTVNDSMEHVPLSFAVRIVLALSSKLTTTVLVRVPLTSATREPRTPQPGTAECSQGAGSWRGLLRPPFRHQ
eukprot:COSAG04_NODE_6809_length_1251_cov_2.506076_2_plen_189_part_01